MSISLMKKLSLIALKEDSDRLMKKLMWLSCVQLDTVDANESQGLELADFANERVETDRLYKRCESAIRFLTPYDKAKQGLFSPGLETEKENFNKNGSIYKEALGAAEKAEELQRAESELRAEINNKTAMRDALIPWRSYDVPFAQMNTRDAESILGTVPLSCTISQLETAILEKTDEFQLEYINSDINVNYISLIVYCKSADKVKEVLSRFGFIKSDFKAYKDTAEREKEKLDLELSELNEREKSLEAQINELALALPNIKRCSDILNTEIALINEKQKLMQTGLTVFMSAWVPEKSAEKVSKLLDSFDCFYEYSEPQEGDDVPVYLMNRQPMKAFEPVIELFSLPAYGTYDPTFFVSLFYFVIFGFMLADVAYGLILAVGGFLAYKFLNLPKGTKNLILMFAICGISCTITGLLMGSYFGDLPKVMSETFGSGKIQSLVIWFDPVNDPITFLIISLAIGAIHLLFGMGIKFYMLCRNGKVFDAIADIGSWYVLFAGIGLFFINSAVGAGVAVIGALMLICTQGRNEKNIIMKFLKGLYSIYGIMNYVSDLLSYSRIMALGVASAVIASVVNLLATLLPRGIPGFCAMVLILLGGHVLNLAINLLGSFVHTSRLQYIEFFGKFYEDGGRMFKPIAPELNYSTVSEEKPKKK